MAILHKPISQAAVLSSPGDNDALMAVEDYQSAPGTRLLPLVNLHAGESQRGLVELATTAEAQAGTDTARAVTPAGVAAAIGYTEYVALVSQSGTNAPTAVEIKNTTGTTVIFTRVLAGLYKATFSAPIIIVNKTSILTQTGNANAGKFTAYRGIDDTFINLVTFNTSFSLADGQLNSSHLVVRIYQ
jgi:hypothetical protein